MSFAIRQKCFTRKRLAKKVATIKRFEYLLLGSKLKKQTGMPKDQYKFLKDQRNVSYNNREYSVKVKDSEKEDVNYRYIDNKYKDLINNIFMYGLKEKDLHVTGIDNRVTGVKILSMFI